MCGQPILGGNCLQQTPDCYHLARSKSRCSTCMNTQVQHRKELQSKLCRYRCHVDIVAHRTQAQWETAVPVGYYVRKPNQTTLLSCVLTYL